LRKLALRKQSNYKLRIYSCRICATIDIF